MILETIKSHVFPHDYRGLANGMESHNLFSSPLWFDNFLQTVVKENGIVYWYGLKTDKAEPVFLLPIWQTLQPTQLSSLANYYTTLYEPLHCLTDESQLTQAIQLVAQAICQLKWDVLDFYPLNPASSSFQLLAKAFSQQKKQVSPYLMFGNWFLVTQNQSFKDYYMARPSQLKNTIKRRGNKLKQHSVEYRLCQHPEEVTSATALFQQTYQASWKQDEPYPEFIPGLAKIAAEQGWLRLGLLLIDQQVAAAQLWLTVHQTAYIYKLCQHPSFDAFSPGSQLTAYLMEYAIDVDKVTKVDFLSGDDAYKKDWMSHREERWGLQIANPKTGKGFLIAAKNSVGPYIKPIQLRINTFMRMLK